MRAACSRTGLRDAPVRVMRRPPPTGDARAAGFGPAVRVLCTGTPYHARTQLGPGVRGSVAPYVAGPAGHLVNQAFPLPTAYASLVVGVLFDPMPTSYPTPGGSNPLLTTFLEQILIDETPGQANSLPFA